MSRIKNFLKMASVAALISVTAGSALAQMGPPFGNEHDVDYALDLWAALEAANLAGPDAIRTFPYEGVEPHGSVLEVFYSKLTVGDFTSDVAVKRNYGPPGVEVEAVMADAAAHLGKITVMFKREAGYDDENGNWFYVRYLPDGSVDLDDDGMGIKLAGRIAKGMDTGCIACHVAAPGDDYLFSADHIK